MPTRPEQQLNRIERLVEEAKGLEEGELNGWKERARLAVADVYGDTSDQLKRFDKIRWTLGAFTSGTPRSRFTEARYAGLRSSVAMLQAIAEDITEKSRVPNLPARDPSQFHPWVSDAAARLWEDGHRREAVQAAATAVETWLRTKTGVHHGSSASLAASAFALTDPDPGTTRLRFSGFEPGSDAWKSAHEGAGAFGRGCMLRIRNLYTHDNTRSEGEDLEALAALSLLARWIDEAEVVEGSSAD